MKLVAQGIVVLLAVFAVIYAETSEDVSSDESILNSPKTNDESVAATPAEDEKEDEAVALKEEDEGRSVQLKLS